MSKAQALAILLKDEADGKVVDEAWIEALKTIQD